MIYYINTHTLIHRLLLFLLVKLLMYKPFKFFSEFFLDFFGMYASASLLLLSIPKSLNPLLSPRLFVGKGDIRLPELMLGRFVDCISLILIPLTILILLGVLLIRKFDLELYLRPFVISIPVC